MSNDRSWKQAMWRGFNRKCPECGEGALFESYLGLNKTCPHCHEDLSHAQADDAPPYFTMLIVGHVVVPGLWITERRYEPPILLELGFWLIVTLVMTLWLLPRVKGAIVGLQWALKMHGFEDLAVPHRRT
jgi:uncharacterized protein (DUF983 family)